MSVSRPLHDTGEVGEDPNSPSSYLCGPGSNEAYQGCKVRDYSPDTCPGQAVLGAWQEAQRTPFFIL